MNKQEIFNKVKNHLLTQYKQSFSDNECRYRGPDGLMCAVGCLISDAAYDPTFEGRIVDSSPVEHALKNSGITVDDDILDMLSELQRIHDSVDVENWSVYLNDLEEKLFPKEEV